MSAVPLSQVAVHLRPEDNVAVAARNLPAGAELEHNGSTLMLAKRVGLGHKIALHDIRKGEAIYKYGQIIGFASQDIPAGNHVHVHNVSADAFERDYAFCRDCPPPPAPAEPRYFMGYDRGDGRYGTRNYVAIISTVNCSASTSKTHGPSASRWPCPFHLALRPSSRPRASSPTPLASPNVTGFATATGSAHAADVIGARPSGSNRVEL